jgi:hypothetical protein
MSPVAREHSFDELTRGMASGSISRGKALRLMGAALVGGALASIGIGEAAADPPGCKRNGKVCTKDKVCCSKNCDSSSGTCADAPPTCGSIGATCTINTDCCSGRCVSDVCAEPCPSGTDTLSNGTCATPCGNCSAGCGGCVFEVGGGGAFYCYGSGALNGCESNADCAAGQFCGHPEPIGPGACTTTC